MNNQLFNIKLSFIFPSFINNIYAYYRVIYINLVVLIKGINIDTSKKTSIFTCLYSNHNKILSSSYILYGYYNNQSFSAYE
jgi:hypothetical protein